MTKPTDSKVKALVAKYEASLKSAEVALGKARKAAKESAKAEETIEKEAEN